jgi:hypothetical protein
MWRAGDAQSIQLDHVDGLIGSNQLPVGTPVTFHFKFNNNNGAGCRLLGSTNGLRFSSPNGATWQTPVGAWVSGIQTNYYDGGTFVNYYSANGVSPDTVAFAGYAVSKPGFADGYNSVVFTITTTFPPSSVGKTFRIDSSYFPPSGTWLWSQTSPCNADIPQWSGPHSFSIVYPSAGNGDVNCDNARNSADIIYMVNYVFKSGPAPCSGN